MRTILSPAERIRNARVQEIMKAKGTSTQGEKASQIKEKQVNQGNKPMYLTPIQMDKVKELQKEQGMTRDEAVAWALDNIK